MPKNLNLLGRSTSFPTGWYPELFSRSLAAIVPIDIVPRDMLDFEENVDDGRFWQGRGNGHGQGAFQRVELNLRSA